MHRLHQWSLRHPAVGDGLWAVAALLFGLGETHVEPWPGWPGPYGGLVLGVLYAGLVPLRRRYPDAVVPAAVLVEAGRLAAGAWLLVPDPGFLVLLHWAADRCSPRTGRAALAVALLTGPAAVLRALAGSGGHGTGFADLGYLAAVAGACSLPFLLCWLLGRRARSRREAAEAALARAAEARTELARAEARSRIAGELHDVIAHDLMAMTVQAGAAGHVLPAHPGPAGEAARGVGDLGRRVLSELAHLERVLRA
ncbi:histidine kinase dimerization/phosphoacceptor domain-containing protein [Kitasatospora sp. NPDC051853]|uniref:histidine kinase dimerization/phosphoacceptor domain-containing protein n=1 Tax=Kitasatospora sp. NPDC051853 TaxID=3364058 RepID=UPI0037B94846